MKMSRKVKMSYSAEFKAKVAIDAIKEDKTVLEIVSEKQVDIKSLRDWKKELVQSFYGKQNSNSFSPSPSLKYIYLLSLLNEIYDEAEKLL